MNRASNDARRDRFSAVLIAVFLPLVAAGSVALNVVVDRRTGFLGSSQLLFGSMLVLLMGFILARGRLFRGALGLTSALFGLAAYATGLGCVLTLLAAREDASAFMLANANFSLRLIYLGLVAVASQAVAVRCRQFRRFAVLAAWLVLAVLFSSHAVVSRSAGMSVPSHLTGLFAARALVSAGAVAVAPVFLLHKGLRRWIGLALCLVLGVLTLRRSAVIAVGVGAFAGLLVGFRQEGTRARIIWSMGLALLLVALVVFFRTSTSAPEFISRLQDLRASSGGSGSGRYLIWPIAWSSISGRSPLSLVFGEGVGSLQEPLLAQFGLAIGAHNDWLDVLASYGIPGLLFLGAFFWALLRLSTRLVEARTRSAPAAVALVVSLVLLSMGTGGTVDPIMTQAFVLLGFLASESKQAGT